jgi:hypothetical protein
MPCTDPRKVACLADAFDLTTTDVIHWELELVWTAVELKLVIVSPHARRAARDESIPDVAIWRVVRDGRPRSKDTTATGARQIGINFEGKIRGRRRIRVKVSWLVRYVIVTVHTL